MSRTTAALPRGAYGGFAANGTSGAQALKHATLSASSGIGRWFNSLRATQLTKFLPVGMLGLIAFAIRSIGLTRSFELWVDEMVYAGLGRTVSHGNLPNLLGQPFFLHPPGLYLIEGGIIKLFGVAGDNMSMVYDLRWINAVLGAVTVVLTFVLARRVANEPIAWACATIIAFDPFVLRNNSRLFLETPATTATLAGLLVLVATLTSAPRQSTGRFVAAGLLLGCGVLTKDALALYAVVPVALAVFWRHTLAPRNASITLAAAATPYLLYIVVLATKNVFGGWLHAKIIGLARMVGLIQTTGFNSPNAPSILSRIVDQIGQFGTSYVLLIACPVAGVFAALSQRPERRLIGLTAVSMGFFGLYTAAFGTFEEQYGYVVMIASVTALGVSAAELKERRPHLRTPALWVGAVFLALTVTLGVRVELTADNGFQQARAWVAANLSPTARVGVTNSTGQWAFQQDARFGVWPSAASLNQHNANYILTQSLPTSEGYGYAKPEMLTWLQQHATPVFHTWGPTNQDTVLWEIDPQVLSKGALQRVGS